jgi:hypothetical protein
MKRYYIVSIIDYNYFILFKLDLVGLITNFVGMQVPSYTTKKEAQNGMSIYSDKTQEEYIIMEVEVREV